MDVLPIGKVTWKVRERRTWGDKAPNARPPCRAVSQAKRPLRHCHVFKDSARPGASFLVKVKSGETLPHAAENKRSRSHNQGHRAAGNEGCQCPVHPQGGKCPFAHSFFSGRSGGGGQEGQRPRRPSPEVGRGARLGVSHGDGATSFTEGHEDPEELRQGRHV